MFAVKMLVVIVAILKLIFSFSSVRFSFCSSATTAQVVTFGSTVV